MEEAVEEVEVEEVGGLEGMEDQVQERKEDPEVVEDYESVGFLGSFHNDPTNLLRSGYVLVSRLGHLARDLIQGWKDGDDDHTLGSGT